jgi:parallel beta-helix repeat protein
MGITLSKSNFNEVTNNKITENEFDGISLSRSSFNNIERNQISNNNRYGISFSGASNNTISESTIAFNSGVGINLKSYIRGPRDDRIVIPSNDNLIYHNNLINNNLQTHDEGSNQWYQNYPSGGNFWSNYTGIDDNSGINQDTPGPDGFGDTPLLIKSEEGISDRYPLMEQFDNGFTLQKIAPNAPYGFSVSAGDGYVKISWLAPLYDGGTPIIRYQINRLSLSGEKRSFTTDGNALEFNDDEVINGEVYYYRISGENEIGQGPESEMITAEPDRPKKSPDSQDNIFQISIETNLTAVILCFSAIILITILIIYFIVRRLIKGKPDKDQPEEDKLGKEKPEIRRSIREKPFQKRSYKKKNDKIKRRGQEKNNDLLLDLIKKK